uniref:Uncharacterized protein n=1 Tax=Panagrolaimus sp. ES5 TaxID=591445 RepID=A0AC34GME1_9BILA
MISALGKGITVLESGVINFADVFTKDQLQKAGVQLFKIVPNLIKGTVPATDPALEQLAKIKKSFKKTIASFKNGIMSQLEALRELEEWTKIFKKLESRANTSATNIARIFHYNISGPIIQGYINTCLGE